MYHVNISPSTASSIFVIIVSNEPKHLTYLLTVIEVITGIEFTIILRGIDAALHSDLSWLIIT